MLVTFYLASMLWIREQIRDILLDRALYKSQPGRREELDNIIHLFYEMESQK